MTPVPDGVSEPRLNELRAIYEGTDHDISRAIVAIIDELLARRAAEASLIALSARITNASNELRALSAIVAVISHDVYKLTDPPRSET